MIWRGSRPLVGSSSTMISRIVHQRLRQRGALAEAARQDAHRLVDDLAEREPGDDAIDRCSTASAATPRSRAMKRRNSPTRMWP